MSASLRYFDTCFMHNTGVSDNRCPDSLSIYCIDKESCHFCWVNPDSPENRLRKVGIFKKGNFNANSDPFTEIQKIILCV